MPAHCIQFENGEIEVSAQKGMVAMTIPGVITVRIDKAAADALGDALKLHADLGAELPEVSRASHYS